MPVRPGDNSWIHWPANHTNNYVAWYIMAWRFLWMPALYLGVAIVALSMCGAYGWRKAWRYLQEVW